MHVKSVVAQYPPVGEVQKFVEPGAGSGVVLVIRPGLKITRKTGNQKSQKIPLYVSAASSKPTPTLFLVLRKMNSVGIHFKQTAIHEVKNKLARGEDRNCSSSQKSRGLFRPMGIDQ
ncbi:hypothetical protein TNCV_1079041 [Trichonephila clavipes]|nr:hypothetical protein TNCV_1079041 [Trichonephila clavipes]